MRDFIDQLVLFNLIAVMRQSGPQHLGQIARWAQTSLKIKPYNVGFFLTTLALSGLIFGFSLSLVWLFLDMILGPAVAHYFNFGANNSLWPKPEWLGVELARIVPAIFIALLVSVYMLLKRSSDETEQRHVGVAGNALQRFIVFTQSVAGILLASFIVALVIHFIAEAYQYAISHKFADVVTFEKFVIIFIRTAPSLALSLCALLYLSPEWRSRSFSFGLMLIIVIIAISALSFVVVLMFLHLDFLPALATLAKTDQSWATFLQVNPAGWDYIIFYVSANVLVSVCGFATVVLFFHAQTAQRIKALQTRFQHRREQHLMAAMPAESPRHATSLVRVPAASRRMRQPTVRRRSAG